MAAREEKKRSVKRLFSRMLIALLLCGCFGNAAGETYKPGDTLDTEILVDGNAQDAVAIIFELEYDHSAMNVSGGEQYGLCLSENTGSLIDLEGLGKSTGIPVHIQISKEAAEGDYVINVKVLEAFDVSEKSVSSVSFVPFGISIKQETQIKVGSIITFGHYEQDNNLDNGKEPIEWIVLDVRDGKAMIISQYGLDTREYNNDWLETNVTWIMSDLRKWLNHDFLTEAFDAEEKSRILTTMVDNSAEQGYKRFRTEGGPDTEDQVFLLSYAEAWEYFKKDDDRMCYPTEYAIAQGAYQSSEGSCWWWLRSPGSSQDKAARIYDDGSRNSGDAYDTDGCVRPVLVMSIN